MGISGLLSKDRKRTGKDDSRNWTAANWRAMKGSSGRCADHVCQIVRARPVNSADAAACPARRWSAAIDRYSRDRSDASARLVSGCGWDASIAGSKVAYVSRAAGSSPRPASPLRPRLHGVVCFGPRRDRRRRIEAELPKPGERLLDARACLVEPAERRERRTRTDKKLERGEPLVVFSRAHTRSVRPQPNARARIRAAELLTELLGNLRAYRYRGRRSDRPRRRSPRLLRERRPSRQARDLRSAVPRTAPA